MTQPVDTPRLLALTPRLLALAAAATFASPALAQSPPDAGQLLQQQRTAPTLPAPSPDFRIEPQAPAEAAPGGAQVVVQRVELSGHSVFDEATLQAVLGDLEGASFDLAGLRGLANLITIHYRTNGYPFARAFLPAQTARDGVVHIEIMEGRYGQVIAQGDDALTAFSNSFLAPLVPGEVIENHRLERTTLILDDQPGLRASPLIRPGQELGTGDLVVEVTRDQLITGDISVDNHGNRYSGYHRARANIQFNSPFMVGDQISLRGLASEESQILGSATYSLPLGGSGLRGQVGVAHTYYDLGREFSVLKATGTSTTYSAGLSYPLLRSQPFNITLGGVAQYRHLVDKIGQTGTENSKSSYTLPLTLQFDWRDGFAGGGITFGSFGWTPGRLRLDSTLQANDQASARSAGTFHRFNLDIARLQALSGPFSAYVRFSGQVANKNLDSSEGFSLGGPLGVRAYPTGEASGDEGWLGQAEIRYDLAPFTPYVFFDAGGIRTNANPWQAGANNSRSLSGGGLGLRASYEGWSLDSSVSWRTATGGRPQSDSRNDRPQFWLTAGYTF